MNIKDPKLEQEYEKAVQFLVKHFNETGNNPKPVIWHSIKVGIFLYQNNYSKDIIIAGILHDLLEDTKLKESEIEKEFSKKILDLVKVNTFDTNNPNKLKRCIDMYNRCKKYGKDALIIKAADILDNSDFFIFGDKKTKLYLIEKWGYFLEISKSMIGTEKAWKDLDKKFKLIKI